MVDTHILVQGFGREPGKMTSSKKKALSLKNSSPGLKAEVSQQVKTPMKSTIHKCIVNVTPVTSPTQYTKLGK